LEGRDDNDFIPVPELEINNADLFFRFVGKGLVIYANPVNDPLFSAHRPVTYTLQTGNASYYQSDFPGSTLACTQQVSPILS
jgi:hypothetical protein